MPENPNPYEAPHTVDTSNSEMESAAASVNFPGGMKNVVPIGIGGGLIVAFTFNQLNRNNMIGAEIGLPTVLAVWVGEFALVGWLLPGSTERRIGRAAFMAFLALPATILYVPVCGFVMATSMGATGDSGGMVLGSLVAFTSVLLLFAVFIRYRARATWVGSGQSTVTGNAGDISDPTASVDEPDQESQRDE